MLAQEPRLCDSQPAAVMKPTLLIVTFALSCRVFGRNDWSKACFDGTCSFEIEESVDNMGGTIEIVMFFVTVMFSDADQQSVRFFFGHFGHHRSCWMADSELHGKREKPNASPRLHR